jgi:hypothetical protein
VGRTHAAAKAKTVSARAVSADTAVNASSNTYFAIDGKISPSRKQYPRPEAAVMPASTGGAAGYTYKTRAAHIYKKSNSNNPEHADLSDL